MARLKLKPRPLRRETATHRDDRLFIVACDDTYAPRDYFNFFRFPRLQIHVIPAAESKSSPMHVLRALDEVGHQPDDERWLLLDTDHSEQGHHQRELARCLREARQKGIRIAFSRPCFETWLLLHHSDMPKLAPGAKCDEVIQQLRATRNGYNKTKLRREDFPSALVPEACRRARLLDTNPEAELPTANTSRVYRLWQALALSRPNSLPPEIQDLAQEASLMVSPSRTRR